MEQFILEVMKLVELDSLSNALVGRPGISGLSVEQRKRLTISVELVANPSIVFMDEPTSGVGFLEQIIIGLEEEGSADKLLSAPTLSFPHWGLSCTQSLLLYFSWQEHLQHSQFIDMDIAHKRAYTAIARW